MFNRKSSFVPAAFILTAFFGVSAAKAQNAACPYSLASLQGNYAIVATYGSNFAEALGSEHLDGNGIMTRTSLINEPTPGSTTGARTIVTTTQTGTYTVNCNGTGQFSRTVTANGVTTHGVDDFIITAAVRAFNGSDFVLLATGIADIQQGPSSIVPGGIFVTRVHTRLPN